ncbi:hypothetical protein B0H14DRAFT_2734540, partial [Mycena olivaceomarginata]
MPATVSKKRRRTLMACAHCRRRKTRCITSEQPPTKPCANCTKKHLNCEYFAVDPDERAESTFGSTRSITPPSPFYAGRPPSRNPSSGDSRPSSAGSDHLPAPTNPHGYLGSRSSFSEPSSFYPSYPLYSAAPAPRAPHAFGLRADHERRRRSSRSDTYHPHVLPPPSLTSHGFDLPADHARRYLLNHPNSASQLSLPGPGAHPALFPGEDLWDCLLPSFGSPKNSQGSQWGV